MSHLRYNFLHKRWVIFAPDRIHRPSDYIIPPEQLSSDQCPFCPGNEHLTPPEIFALRPNGGDPNTPNWQIRIVPNKFPALTLNDEPAFSTDNTIQSLPGFGAHEVIIDSPSHNHDLPDLDIKAIEDIIAVYRSRMMELEQNPHLKYILIFKNQGFASGATLSHPHSQLIATPVIPQAIQIEHETSEDFFHKNNRCFFCYELENELSSGERLIFANSHFLAYVPYASRVPYEICLIPREHQSHFWQISKDQIFALANILKPILLRLSHELPKTAYNLVLHTAPNQTSTDNPHLSHYFHWHIEILPRLSNFAGFEIGSGFFINTVLPETAAQNLRIFQSEPFIL